MTQRVVSVKLQAQVDGFTAGMRKARSSVDDLTKSSNKMTKQDAFSSLANKAAIAGVGVATAVGVAVKRFADFDQAMSAVQANTGATGASLESLRDAAVKMGADSVFSAKEAADGINELGKAGLSTADILGGGLKGSLDLAAAGQIGVAQAAETTASALTQFKLGGDQAVHVADLLTNGANKAQGGVGDLGAALNQTGLVAAATGLTIDETAAGLSAFASAGLIGSDAGTSFKTMLQRLSAPTGQAAELMEKLGISAYDANGNFVGLETVAGQLQKGMADLTPATRNAAMATIFGSDAVRAANVLYSQGAEGIADWTSKVTEQGAAAKQAATLTDNLKGDIERLGGALDSVFIQTGSGANGGLRTLTQGITGLVEVVGGLPGPLLLAGGGLTAFALLAPKGISAYREYAATMDTLGLSMDKISAKSPRAGKALAGLQKAGAVAALAAISVQIQELIAASSVADVEVGELAESLEDLGTSAKLSGGIADLFRDQGGWLQQKEQVVTLTEAVERFGIVANDAVGGGLLNNLERMSGNGAVPKFEKQVTQLDEALAQMVAAGNAYEAQAALDQMMAGVQPENIEAVRGKFVQFDEALRNVATAAETAEPRVDGLSGAQAIAADSAEEAADATKAWSDALTALNQPTLDARAAAREMEQAVADATGAIKENGKSLDITSEKGRKNQAALDAVAEAANNQIGALQANGASQKTLQGTLAKSRDRLIETYLQFDNNRTRAKAYADSVLAIPQTRTTTATFRTQGYSELKAAGDYFKSLQDRRVTLTVGTVQVGGTRVNAGQFADGGAVYGPGTGRSDSITARLSNGEHVLTAAEVRALGGQGAVYALRAAVRQGNIPKFADGGAVQSASRFAPTSSRPVINVSATSGATVATVDANSIRAMAREIATQTARETANAIIAGQRGTALADVVGRKVG